MKKILITVAAASLSVASFAQGFINWTGSGTSLIAQTNGTAYSSVVAAGSATLTGTLGNTTGNSVAGNAALGYTGYYYELLTSASAVSAPTTVSAFTAWSDTGLSATNGNASNGKIGQVAGTADTQVNNWPANGTQAIILVGWSANLGNNWGSVLSELQSWGTLGQSFANNSANAAFFGVSAFGSGVQSVVSSVTGNQVIGAGAGEIFNNAAAAMQLNELGVVATPEPGTMALAALGGASLLLFRRKK